MISRSHVRLAVLSMVAMLAVSTLGAAQGEVVSGTASARGESASGTAEAAACPSSSAPANPADLTDLTDPAEPAEPADPADPADLTDPTDLTDPADENDPTGSTDVTAPVDSTDLTASTGGASAAEVHSWGTPAWCAEFDDQLDPADWVIYDSAGHDGQGRRSPDQLFIGNGSLYLYGRADGTTAGLGSRHSQVYGRWETRVRMYEGADSYHPIALLWPDGGGGGVHSATGEEIDFLGVMDRPGRWRANFYLETPQGEEQSYSEADLTTWHTYAVENSPGGVVGYLDGREWFRSSRSTRSPMSACLQLDWFPGHGSPGEAWMEVDWLRVYPLDPGGTGGGTG
ncbi:glycoside hydrolase family 16 protein [Streptosporangium canum]|uniref:glycoside hydrolase family 16 protein n=1 Tax=Streptosporangium canum TaxID=324952 RepID=UPI0037A56266